MRSKALFTFASNPNRAPRRWLAGLVVTGLLSLFLVTMPPADAGAPDDPLVRSSLNALTSLAAACSVKDAVDGNVANGVERPFSLCDDGIPPAGGGSKGIPVPAAYHQVRSGDDYTGLPAPATAAEVAAAEARDDIQPESDNRITLDVNVSLPPASAKPVTGSPVLVFMHGCCQGNKVSWEATTSETLGERWHHSNAWFASRGYVVVTYTARGFRNANDEGSTGTTQLDSRRYEINDYQYLVGLLADHDFERRAAGLAPIFDINPQKVAPVGGSYGGGFAWVAATDPAWRSPARDVSLKAAAMVTKYGWTDLAESLVTNGQFDDRNPLTGTSTVAPTDPRQALTKHPIGTEKQSIVAGLYATGNQANAGHTTFPNHVHETYARLQTGEPYNGDPTIEEEVDRLIRDSSAYYQTEFWNKVEERGLRLPIYAAGTWTDPLFPTTETIRFYNKLRSIDPSYPITMYFGDYQHFTVNKIKEWGDMCGTDHHVCAAADYRRDGVLDYTQPPVGLVRNGINTRMSDFIDHYLLGTGPKPAADVRANTTICPQNVDAKHPADEPGDEYRADNWRRLSPQRTTYHLVGGGMTSSQGSDSRAATDDPVVNLANNGSRCIVAPDAAPGTGVVQAKSAPLTQDFTMMGVPVVRMDISEAGTAYWIVGRLYDEYPDGELVLISRQSCTVNRMSDPGAGCEVFDLSGNGWDFKAGHRIVVELSQADAPYLRKYNAPSTLSISNVRVEIPKIPRSQRTDPR